MPSHGTVSRGRLEHAHPALRAWAERLILVFDHTVVCSYRNEADQEEAFRNGKSKVHFPNSYHNLYPSRALDLAPWDFERLVIDWKAEKRFILMAGMGLQLAREMNLPIVWGGDWDSDTFMRDHDFVDFPHFQLSRNF